MFGYISKHELWTYGEPKVLDSVPQEPIPSFTQQSTKSDSKEPTNDDDYVRRQQTMRTYNNKEAGNFIYNVFAANI